MPRFEFECETDTGAVGLFSAAKCNGLDVVIGEVTLEEWTEMQSGRLLHVPARLSSALDIGNLHVLHIRRIRQGALPPAGIPFAEYRKLYKPPVVIFSCPCCNGGEAIEVQELSISEFESIGGRVIALGKLAAAS